MSVGEFFFSFHFNLFVFHGSWLHYAYTFSGGGYCQCMRSCVFMFESLFLCVCSRCHQKHRVNAACQCVPSLCMFIFIIHMFGLVQSFGEYKAMVMHHSAH